ncbi:alcohol dehydrogenase [Lasiodiplodia theobromae]|uniref:alcohol dehydrogenase n=1 Tax=Lasiodiplodia theobromae TaxID=45133 RepID=UPI0015C3B0A3|nr:alcohol dehydrogenase [Lasiodiplodia theobromae]KAF4545247.1 alcohol dehydrogenase [Lasiodiplodia theobromae]
MTVSARLDQMVTEAQVNCPSKLECNIQDGKSTTKSTASGLWLPSTQKAVITPEMGRTLNLSVHEIPVRPPTSTEAVVKIFYTGLCRSVSSEYQASKCIIDVGKDACFSIGPEPGFPKHNHIAGHEGIGQVIQSHDPSLVGRTVGIRYLGATCGSCAYCLSGLPTSCPGQLNAPKHIAGTFQEYATVPTSCLVALPDGILLSDPAAACGALCAALCSGSAALTALRAARVHAGSIVVVAGVAGAIGHLAGAMARRVFGARVVGIDLGWKCDLLRQKQHHEQYADVLLDAAAAAATGQEWSDFEARLVRACTRLRPDKALARAADAVVVCASSESAFQNLDKYVCDGGRIVCVGVPRNLVLSISIHALVERNLHLTGNLMGDHLTLEDIPDQMQRMVDCKSIGKIVARIGG